MDDSDLTAIADQIYGDKQSQDPQSDEDLARAYDRIEEAKRAKEPPSMLQQAALLYTGPAGQAAAGLTGIPGPIGEASREFFKGGAKITGEMIGGGLAVSAKLLDLTRPAANFVNAPLDQVKTQRDALQAERDSVEQSMNDDVKSGSANSPMMMASTSRVTALESQIDEADKILASGQVKTKAADDTSAVKWLSDRLTGAANQVRTGTETGAEQLMPTTEDMDRSVVGQIAGGAGQFGATLPFMMAGTALGTAAFAAQLGGQQFDEAKAAGASDDTAKNAAALGALGAPLQVLAAHIPAASLAGRLAGTTPIKAMLDIGRAAAVGGVGQGGLGVYENFVARVSGYDPNRPLDEGVYQQALIGATIDTFATGAGRVPGLIKYYRGADVDVRERAPSPHPLPQAESSAEVKPLQPPTEPIEGQPPAPTDLQPGVQRAPEEPLSQATQQVAATQAAKPEEIIAQAGDPGVALQQSLVSLGTEEPPAVSPKPEEPAAQPGAEPALGETAAPALTSEAANIRGETLPPPLPEVARTGTDPAQVKAITNQAASDMGLEQRVHYVPNTDALPGRVQRSLSEQQHNDTAQMIYDKGLGEWWVVGDRFHNAEDLSRALIEETMPRVYRDVTDLQIEHNPNDPRLGYYDIGADRPVLNMGAIMRSGSPFSEASKTALEEVVAHQGISKLYGSREGASYVAAMKAVRDRFDATNLSNILATEKGYKNLDDMAKAYGFDDYASNPRHNNALTEELIGAYSQRYQNRAAIDRSPVWYKQALNTLGGGLRRRFGMGLSDIDVQNLVGDSMGALRKPKYGTPSLIHPEIGAQAKNDMFLNQLSSLRGNEPAQTDFLNQFDEQTRAKVAAQIQAGNEARFPKPPPLPEVPASAEAAAEAAHARLQAGQEGTAQIGNQFVSSEMQATRAGLGPGQDIRQQPERFAGQPARPFSERMAYAQPDIAVYDTRSLAMAQAEAAVRFQQDFHGDIHQAMAELRATPAETDQNAALRLVVNKETNRQIEQFRAENQPDTAAALERVRDKFNQTMASKVTDTAQALNAQKLFYTDGAASVGRLRDSLVRPQDRIVGGNADAKRAYDSIQEIGGRAANRMIEGLGPALDTVQARMDRLTRNPEGLAGRYIDELAATINERMGKLGFTAADRPILEDLFKRFETNIQEQIREKAPDIPTPETIKTSAKDTIREAIGNLPMFQRAWQETVERLKTDNPNALFFSKLDRAMAEPFGDRGVRNVVRESGNDLRDIIFKHYTNQDRIGNELAQSLTENLPISQADAFRVQQQFDSHYKQILKATSEKELQQTLARIGSSPQRAVKGELDRLVDLMAIGGLNKEEYYNLLAPRFKLGQWDPETVKSVKAFGEVLQQIRDEGGPEVYKNQIAAQIADQIARSQKPLEINVKRGEALWMAGLLTGPITHGSYYIQNFAQVMTNLLLRSAFRPGNDVGTVVQSMKDMFNGMIHSARNEFPFIVQTGIHTQRELPGGELAGMKAAGIPYRNALEATPLPGGMRNPFNWYKYVGRVLQGMETVFYRGAQNAITRSLAMRMADERGYNSSEALRFAEQIVYGTENDRQEAIAQSITEQKKYGFSEPMRQQRVQELIDQKRYARAPELADESHRFALHSVYRESPYGMLGQFARKLNDVRGINPTISLVTPFINLPSNVANEFMNWTPVGVWRGRDAIPGREGTQAIEALYKDVPGFERQVKNGAISSRELRDLSYEYMAKGVIGTLGMGALGGLMYSMKDNPDPPFWISGGGPADMAKRDALRASGWQPYSIKLGNAYFDYEASPFKGALSILGSGADYMKYGKNDPQNWQVELLNSAVKGGLSSITDSSFLQGIQTLLAASSGSGVDAQTTMERFMSSEISSGLGILYGGTGVRQIIRSIDPTEYGGKGLGAMILRNIPVVNSWTLQPKLNVLGENVQSSPIHRLLPTMETSDPVWRYLADNNIKISLPNAGQKVGGVQLTPDELHDYIQIRGTELKKQIAQAIQDPDFTSLDKEQQDIQIKELERDATDIAKYQIFQRREHAKSGQ